MLILFLLPIFLIISSFLTLYLLLSPKETLGLKGYLVVLALVTTGKEIILLAKLIFLFLHQLLSIVSSLILFLHFPHYCCCHELNQKKIKTYFNITKSNANFITFSNNRKRNNHTVVVSNFITQTTISICILIIKFIDIYRIKTFITQGT